MASSADGEAYFRRMFSPGFVFPLQDSDDSMKVEISDLVSFGDMYDTFNAKPQDDLVRQFHPGKYKVTMIKTHQYTEQEECNDPLLIFHHEDIDPNSLARQVLCMSEDYLLACGGDNHINRNDWGQSGGCMADVDEDYMGVDEETVSLGYIGKANKHVVSLLKKHLPNDVTPTVPYPDYHSDSHYLILFTKRENANSITNYILRGQVRRSSVMRHLFSVQDDDGKTISLGVDYQPFNNDDFVYGDLFQDAESESYFALIVHGYLEDGVAPWEKLFTAKEKKGIGFTTVEETGLKFPMSRFMVNGS